MLILCVVSAEETSKTRPLLADSIQTLLDTAQTRLSDNWDQTLDLPQVCRLNKNEELSLFNHKDRFGHIIVLSPLRCARFTLCRPWCVAQV